MDPTEIERFREMLENKRAELMRNQHSPEGLAIERVADVMDEAIFANERELLVDTLNRQAEMFAQVVEALRRTDDGSYGLCAQCGEPLSCKRLNAVPWAALCIRCQELADCRPRQMIYARRLHAA